MGSAVRRLSHAQSGTTNERIMQLARFPYIRKAISGALAGATPEKVEVSDGGRYVRFRIADPRSFHPALFATISVGGRGTKVVIGTPKAAIKKPAALASFIKRLGKTALKTEARRSLVYQLRSAGIIGGSKTQSVLVPVARVLAAAARFGGGSARRMSRTAANPILATIGFNPGKRRAAKNPRVCSICGKPIKGEMVLTVPPLVEQRLGIAQETAAHKSCFIRQERAAGRPVHLKNPAMKHAIPGLSKWHMAAGGTAAAPGKHSYSIFPSVGNYYISPVSHSNGRHRGYLVQFANTQGKLSGPLLWRNIGMARSPNQGVAMVRAHYDKNFAGKNPLTRRESAKILRQARAELRHGSVFRPGHTRSSMAGQAFGRAQTVVGFGARSARPAARKVIKRAVRTAGTAMSNPGAVEIKVPFRDGQKITPARMRQWIDSLPVNPITTLIKKRFEKGIEQYKRFHLGSEPTSFTYRAIPMGSQGKRITDVDVVVSEGKEWAAPYQVPKSSAKYDPSVQGRYIHAHGESKMDIDIKKAASTKKLPERFHTADGKFVGVVPSRNVKITDWYRG